MKKELKEPYRTFFGTLANQTRIDIIEALEKKPLCVADICAMTGHAQPTVSHSLRRLLHCGFVTMIPRGKERVYTLNKETIKPLLMLMHAHMGDYCCKIVKSRDAGGGKRDG